MPLVVYTDGQLPGVLIGGALLLAYANGAKVAESTSHQITRLDPRRGLAANLATASMVLLASRWGMPVSTTHVSCGALFGLVHYRARHAGGTIRGIIIAWLVTLPARRLCAPPLSSSCDNYVACAVLAATCGLLLRRTGAHCETA
jgi:PiT family inorganic phosphate transporter